jgi:hypothetical protein
MFHIALSRQFLLCSLVSLHPSSLSILHPPKKGFFLLDYLEGIEKVIHVTMSGSETQELSGITTARLNIDKKLTCVVCQQGRLCTWLGILATHVKQSFQPKQEENILPDNIWNKKNRQQEKR